VRAIFESLLKGDLLSPAKPIMRNLRDEYLFFTREFPDAL